MSDLRNILKDLDIDALERSFATNPEPKDSVINPIYTDPESLEGNEINVEMIPPENERLNMSIVDGIIQKGLPEDKYGLPNQLKTIESLRKKGFDDERIFNAMELEVAEKESTQQDTKKLEDDLLTPKKKPATARDLDLTADKDDFWDRLKNPTKAYFLAGALKKIAGGTLQHAGTVQPREEQRFRGREGFLYEFDERTPEQALEQTLENPLFKKGQELFKDGLIDFAERPDLQPTDNFMDYEWSDPEFIASAVGNALPSFLTYIVPSVGVAITTRNPALAFATTMATAYGMEAGGMYNQAREEGLSPQDASNVAMTVGTINSLLSLLPAGAIFTKMGIGTKPINDILVKGVIRKQLFKNASTKALVGGSTELIEELLQEMTNYIAEVEALGMEPKEGELVKRLQAVGIGALALGSTTGLGSGVVQTNTDVKQAVFEKEKSTLQEKIIVESQAQMINDDEANDFNIEYNKEDDGSKVITESELKNRGYDPKQFPLIGENENGEKEYGVRVNGTTDSKGNISLSSRATGSTILEEVIESRVKKLRNSKNIQERALADKIEIWANSVRKKASEIGLNLRFGEEGEGNLELFSDAILYTKGGFKGLDQKFEDSIYIPDDLANEFIATVGEMSDGTKIFDALKGDDSGIAPNQEFASGVDTEMQSQMFPGSNQKRGPPTAKIPKTRPTKKSKSSNQIIPDSPAFKKWFSDSKVVDENNQPLVVYHGTNKDFDEFKLDANEYDPKQFGFHFGTSSQANERIDNLQSAKTPFQKSIQRMGQSGTNIKPVYLSIKNPLRLPDISNWENAYVLARVLSENHSNQFGPLHTVEDPLLEMEEKSNMWDDELEDAQTKYIRDLIKSKGYDGIVYSNQYEGAENRPMFSGYTQETLDITGNDSYIAFEPEQIKSVFNEDFDAGSSSFQLEPDENTKTPAFKKWFGDSKLVNDDGSPMVLFHGTNKNRREMANINTDGNDFTTFESNQDIQWFGNNTIANEYAFGPLGVADGSMYPVYLKSENPKIFEDFLIEASDPVRVYQAEQILGVDLSQSNYSDDAVVPFYQLVNDSETVRQLKEQGFDSIVIEEKQDKLFDRSNITPTIGVFEPTQIKSAFNQGTFDENNANISYQLEPDVVEQAVGLYPDVMGDTGKSASKAERLQRFLGRLKTRVTKANPISEDIPLGKMIGKPKNLQAVRVELKDGGIIYAGPKSADQWLEQVNSILSEEEQIRASQWYEEAYPAFLDYFGEENAVPYMVGWLMGNVNASPQDALSNLYLGLEQLKAEFPSMKSAGLPGPAQNLKKLFAGERTEAGAGVKLYDFLDSALGKKTRTIMQDDPRAGGAVADDRHTNRDAGFVDATMYDKLLKLAKNPSDLDDIIIDQKRTYKQAVDKNKKPIFNKDGSPKMKGSVAGPNETQYEWAVKSFNQMTAEINATGYLGGDLAPAQIQAIGWTAIARALQTSEGMSIPDSFKSQEPAIAFEVNFGKNTPYGKKFGNAYNELTLPEQQKLTDEVVKSIVPELAKDIGLDVLKTSSNVIGAWKGDVSANQTIVVRGSNQAIKGMMNSLGLLLQQDSIGSIKMNSSFPGLGLAWHNPALADPNIAGIVYRILEQELDSKLVPGFFMEKDFTGEGEGFNVKNEHAMIIGTDIKKSELAQFENQLENAIAKINDKLDIDMKVPVAFGQKYEATNNQWQKSTQGEAYTDSLVEQFGKSLPKRLNDYYAPRVEKRLQERLLKNKRKQLKSYQIVPDTDLASELDAMSRIDESSPLDISEENYHSVSGIGKAIRRKIFDSMDPIVSLQEDIKSAYLGEASIREHLDVVLASELSVGRIPELIKDFNKQAIEGKDPNSFVSRLSKDLGMTIDEFSQYLHAKHAEVRNAHIKNKTDGERENGSGISSAEAKRIRKEMNQKYGLKNLNKYVNEFRSLFIDPEIKLRYKSGLLSKEDYDNLTDPNTNPIAKNYVPLFREFDDADVTVDSATGQGFDVRGSEYKKAKGSERAVSNIIISATERMHSAIIRSEKNAVNKTLLNLVESFPSTAYEVRGLSYKPEYDQEGEIKYLTPMEEGQRTKDGTRITKENTINVKVDGKVKQIIFKGPQGVKIARAMKDMGVVRVNQAWTHFNTYMRYVNTIANPEFIFSNFIRDLQTAGINIGAEQGSAIRNTALSPRNLHQAWKAVFNVVRSEETDTEWGQLYERMRLAGGKTGFFDLKSIEEKIGNLESKLKAVDDTGNGVVAGGKAVLGFIEDLNEATESAVRLTLFKSMLDAGYSEAQSASASKNVTINFNRKGEWGTVLNTMYLFANAGLQGSMRIFTVLKNSSKARKAVTGLAVMGMMESLYNQMASDEDEEYDKLNDWEKDNYFIMRYGDKDKYFKFRLPYGFNVFKVAGNIAGDAIWANMKDKEFNKTDASWRFINSFFNSYSPLGTGPIEQVLSPTITDPIIQLSTNTNFYGAPIYPREYKFRDPDVVKEWKSTPEIYKNASQSLFKLFGNKLRYDADGNVTDAFYGPGSGWDGDISPETMNYFVKFLGGGLGQSVIRTLNTGASLFDAETEFNRDNIPIVRQFLGEFKKDSEKRILYNLEREMKNRLFSPHERYKYKQYLKHSEDKGQITEGERLKKEDEMEKRQEYVKYAHDN